MSRRLHTTTISTAPFDDQQLATTVLNTIGPFCSAAGFNPRPTNEWRHDRSKQRISVALDESDPNGILDFDKVMKQKDEIAAVTSLRRDNRTATWLLTVQEAKLQRTSVWRLLLGLAFLLMFCYAIYAYGTRHNVWCSLVGTCRGAKKPE